MSDNVLISVIISIIIIVVMIIIFMIAGAGGRKCKFDSDCLIDEHCCKKENEISGKCC